MIGPRKRSTILIVEDDDDSRELMDFCFEDAGYRVLCAATADEALRLMRATPGIDVLLTDYNFPGGDGGSLILRARGLGLVKDGTPALICTAHWRVPVPPDVTLLHKPIAPDTLVRAVEMALDCRAAGQVA